MQEIGKPLSPGPRRISMLPGLLVLLGVAVVLAGRHLEKALLMVIGAVLFVAGGLIAKLDAS